MQNLQQYGSAQMSEKGDPSVQKARRKTKDERYVTGRFLLLQPVSGIGCRY